jgi:hypothetical protein
MRAIRTIILSCVLILVFSSIALAENCQYDTAWGVLTINYNYNDNSVTGSYPHKDGTISGTLSNDGVISGQWWQSDGRGSFVFYLNKSGFTGKWNSAGDSKWRGQWNGKLKGCYK